MQPVVMANIEGRDSEGRALAGKVYIAYDVRMDSSDAFFGAPHLFGSAAQTASANDNLAAVLRPLDRGKEEML